MTVHGYVERIKNKMESVGFSAEKYIEEQSKYILKRIEDGNGRLYLEFGGKLVQDKHAMRVLHLFLFRRQTHDKIHSVVF